MLDHSINCGRCIGMRFTSDESISLVSPMDELLDGERGLMSPPLVVTDDEPGIANGVNLSG